jgi:hypothetical protein
MLTTKFAIDIKWNRRFETEPNLTAVISLQEKDLALAVWTRRTRDLTKIYHSASISEPYRKGQTAKTLVKGIKLYEFRKNVSTDPDYQSNESFELFTKLYWLAFWETERDDEFIIEGQLVDRPFEQKISANVSAFINDLRSRHRERLAEAETDEPEPDFEASEEIPF